MDLNDNNPAPSDHPASDLPPQEEGERKQPQPQPQGAAGNGGKPRKILRIVVDYDLETGQPNVRGPVNEAKWIAVSALSRATAVVTDYLRKLEEDPEAAKAHEKPAPEKKLILPGTVPLPPGMHPRFRR